MEIIKITLPVLLLFVFFEPASFASSSEEMLTISELREAIKDYNRTASPHGRITTSLRYELWHDRIPNAPFNPSRVYPEFREQGGWNGLLGKRKDRPAPAIDALKEAVANYNKRVLKIRQIEARGKSYIKFYKLLDIEYAPRHPEKVYPDFHERGGWDYIVGDTCKKQIASL